ncbi:MAG: hypothetical protein IKD53_09040 [Clostridia bacterium]|nr:hypothetical protein [Clostridia bacterium]
MKRVLTALLALALTALPALAESESFAVRGGITWGMTVQEVLDAEDGSRAEAEREAGFDVLELDDVELYGFVGDLEYFFSADALAACVCEYEAKSSGADFPSLEQALTDDYGAPLESDVERWNLLEDILDGEMESRRADRFSSWQLEDGTLVALVEDQEDSELRLGFYDEMRLVEGLL